MKQFIVTVTLPEIGGNRNGLASILTPEGFVRYRDIFPDQVAEAFEAGWAARLISTMFPVAGTVHGDSLYESVASGGGSVAIWLVDVEEKAPLLCGAQGPREATSTCVKTHGHTLKEGSGVKYHRDSIGGEWLD